MYDTGLYPIVSADFCEMIAKDNDGKEYDIIGFADKKFSRVDRLDAKYFLLKINDVLAQMVPVRNFVEKTMH